MSPGHRDGDDSARARHTEDSGKSRKVRFPSRQHPYLVHNTSGEARSKPAVTKLTRGFPDRSWQDMNRQEARVKPGWMRQKDAGRQEGARHKQKACMTEWLSSNLVFPSKKE